MALVECAFETPTQAAHAKWFDTLADKARALVGGGGVGGGGRVEGEEVGVGAGTRALARGGGGWGRGWGCLGWRC